MAATFNSNVYLKIIIYNIVIVCISTFDINFLLKLLKCHLSSFNDNIRIVVGFCIQKPSLLSPVASYI